MPSNQGDPDQFYARMKKAQEIGLYDALWGMDDGVLVVDCLNNLVVELGYHNYIVPRVIDINDHSNRAYNYKHQLPHCKIGRAHV